MEDNLVIVIDTSNYKTSYSESTPFKAIVTQKYDTVTWVKSITTNKEYELYYYQILESLDIEQITKLINMNEYGK